MSVPLTIEEMKRMIRGIAQGRLWFPDTEVQHPMMIQLAKHAVAAIDDKDCPLSDADTKNILSVLIWWGDQRGF